MNHLDLLDDRCFEVAAACLRLLRDRPGAVLAGGWAVYAHVPSVPSVDTDLVLDGDLPDDMEDALRRQGIAIGPGRQVETISATERFGYWAFGDEDLGIQTPGFVVGDVLEEQTQRVRIQLRDETVQAVVPTPGALALLKTCALHNRDLAYRSFHDGTAGMHVGPQRMPMVRSLSQSYYLRKAGKDLFDLSLLLNLHGARDTMWSLARRFDLEGILPDVMEPIATAVRKSAATLAEHAAVESPATTAEAALAAR